VAKVRGARGASEGQRTCRAACEAMKGSEEGRAESSAPKGRGSLRWPAGNRASTGGPAPLEIVCRDCQKGFPGRAGGAAHAAAFTRPLRPLNQCCALSCGGGQRPWPRGRKGLYRAGGADTLLANRAGKLTVLPSPENPEFLCTHRSSCWADRCCNTTTRTDYGGVADRHGPRWIGLAFTEIKKARRTHHCRIGRLGGGVRDACGTVRRVAQAGHGREKNRRAAFCLGRPVMHFSNGCERLRSCRVDFH